MARIATLTSALLVSLLLMAASSGARSALRPQCRMSQFAVAVGPFVGEATQQRTLALRLVNRGKRLCVLEGYPRLTLYDGRGVIPFVVRHGGDQMISARRPKPVVVRASRSAFVLLNKNQCPRGVTPDSRGTTRLKIGISRRPTAGVASLSFHRAMPGPWRRPAYCGRGNSNSAITVSPFVPTLRAALNP